MKRGARVFSLLLVTAAHGLAGCQTAGVKGGSKTGRATDSKLSAALADAAREASGQGNVRDSLMLHEKLYRGAPDNDDYILAYARDLRHMGRVDDAKLVVRTPANEKDASAPLLTECAMVLVASGEYGAAQDYAQKAVDKDKKSPDALQALALAISGQGDHAHAEQVFARALDVWPQGRDRTPIVNNLAMSQAAQGKITQARATMALATGQALESETYQTNRALLATLADAPVRVDVEPAVQKASIKSGPGIPLIDEPAAAADKSASEFASHRMDVVIDDVKSDTPVIRPVHKPVKSGKMQPIVER